MPTVKELIDALKERDEKLQVVVTADGKEATSASEKLYIFDFAGIIVVSGVPKDKLRTY